MRDVLKGEFSCDRCMAVLEENESIPGWACWTCGVEYRIISVEPDGSSFSVVAAPLPGFGVCDFCGEPKPKWSYPCGDMATDFVLMAKDGKVVQHDTHHSVDDWAACDACAEKIDGDDLEGLTVYAAGRMAEKHGVPEKADDYAMKIRDLHREFWASRKGPKTEIEGSL